MKTFTYTITDEVGLHARPAGRLVQEAKGLSSKAQILFKEKSVDVDKLMAVMSLGIKKGDTVTVQVAGGNEEADARALEQFFQENL